jgi:hypothetical protein
LNGTIPKGYTEPITVKFANNPSNNKAFPPLAAYLTPQTAAAARRFAGPIHPTTAGRFRLVKQVLSDPCAFLCNSLPCKEIRFVWLIYVLNYYHFHFLSFKFCFTFCCILWLMLHEKKWKVCECVKCNLKLCTQLHSAERQ